MGERPLHVLHVIDGLGRGGAERVLVDIANRTVADGHRASVCVTRRDRSRANELDRRIQLLVLDRKYTISPSAVRTLSHWIRSERVDVIHAHMRSTAANMLLLRALRIIRTPVVFHDHYGSIEIDQSIPIWFRLGHRFASYYVGVSDQLRDWARAAGVTTDRSITIPNAIDIARFETAEPSPIRAALGVSATTPIGIAVATLRRDKGIDLLLEAVASSPAAQAAKILIVGADGDPIFADACRHQAEALGLGGVVNFLGASGDVPSLLRAADFGILASRSESGPLVLAEYIAAGLPIVATRVGDIGRRLAAVGVEGFVSPGDVPALASSLDAILSLSADVRRARGGRARALLSADWDIRGSMTRWYAVYRSALATI